jgi:hypothetical protein
VLSSSLSGWGAVSLVGSECTEAPTGFSAAVVFAMRSSMSLSAVTFSASRHL